MEAYDDYRGLQNDQPTYDLTSVLYAVRPERGYFDWSLRDGSRSKPTAPRRSREEAGGPHRFLIVDPVQIARVREAQEWLCSQPPGKVTGGSTTSRRPQHRIGAYSTFVTRSRAIFFRQHAGSRRMGAGVDVCVSLETGL